MEISLVYSCTATHSQRKLGSLGKLSSCDSSKEEKKKSWKNLVSAPIWSWVFIHSLFFAHLSQFSVRREEKFSNFTAREQPQLSFLLRVADSVCGFSRTNFSETVLEKIYNIVGWKHKRVKNSAFEVIAVRYFVNDASIKKVCCVY